MDLRGLAVVALLAGAGCVDSDPAGSDEPPGLQFETDSSTGRATVAETGGTLSWHLLTMVSHDCGPEGQAVVVRMGHQAPYQNDPASSSGAPLNRPDHQGFCSDAIPTAIGQGVDFVVVGDFLEFCTTGTGLARGAHDVSLRVLEEGSGRIVGRAFFTEPIPVCPS